MPEDYKTARRQLTGNMPTGQYDMSKVECTIERKFPEWDRMVQELQAWPDMSYWMCAVEHIQSRQQT